MPLVVALLFLVSHCCSLRSSPIGVVIPLNDFMGSQHTVAVEIGRPPQQFNLLVDSGSSYFWVPSSECYSVTCWVHNTYISSASSTFLRNGTSIAFSYESGYCSGFLSCDNVVIGSLSAEWLAVANATFGEMRVVSPQFLHSHFDGNLGLGWDLTTSDGVPAILSALVAQGMISEPSYSLFLPSGNSILVLGGIPPRSIAPSLFYHPIQRPGLWGLPIETITIGEASSSPSNATMILDSATPGILVDPATMTLIADMISVNSDCDLNTGLPIFEVKTGGKPYPLSWADYVVYTTLDGKTTCESPFQEAVLPLPYDHYIVLGAPFLKVYYAHFDFLSKSIGLIS